MSDEWLDAGHGDGRSLAPVRATTPADVATPTGGRAGTWRAWFGSPLAIVVVAAAVLAGSAGTAYAIRETLFPSIGSTTSRSVWQNPAPPEPPPTTVPATTVPATTVPVTTVPVTTTVPATTLPVTTVAVNVSVVPTVTVDDDSGHDDSDNSGSGSDDSGSGNSGHGSDDD